MLRSSTQNLIHFGGQLKKWFHMLLRSTGQKKAQNQTNYQAKSWGGSKFPFSVTLLMLMGEEKMPLPLHRSSTEEWWCREEASRLLGHIYTRTSKNGNGSGSDRVESPCIQNQNPKSKPEPKPETDSGGNPLPKPNPNGYPKPADKYTHIHMYKQEATNNKYFHDSTFNKFNSLSKQIIINIL